MKKYIKIALSIALFLILYSSVRAITILPLNQGGTGLGTSTPCDLLVGTTSIAQYTRLPCGSSGKILQSTGSSLQWAVNSAVQAWLIGNDFIYNATTTDKVGVGTNNPVGQLDVFKTITLAQVGSDVISEDTGLFSTFSGGENPQYDIFAWANTGFSKVFSAVPYSDGGFVSGANYSLRLDFAAVPGANGYRIFRDRNATGFWTEYADVTVTHLYDSDYTVHAQSVVWLPTTGEAADAVPTSFNLDSMLNYNDGTTLYGLNTNGVIYTSNKLTANGSTTLTDLSLSGRFADSLTATGTRGQLLQSTGTSTLWVSTSTLGISGGGGSGNAAFTIGNGIIYNATSTDKVGIGTNNPQFKIEIAGDASTTNIYLPHTNSSSKGIIYKDYPAFGALNPTAFLHDYAPSTADGYNIFLGVSSGNFTLSPGGGASSKASNDIGIGNSTLSTLTTGYQNIGIGSSALTANTTGFDNTAIGHQSTLSNTTGKENTGYGANTLTNNTTGNYNTGIGGSALNGNATGSANVAIGYQAGTNFGYYASSTYLGYNADSSVGSLTNSMGLGYDSKTTKSNQVVIGSTTVTETLLNGKVGVGMTPAQAIDINGIVQANSFIATSTTATSTFPNASTTNFVAKKIINYNAENTASVGVPYIVAYGRVVGTTTTVSNVFQNSAGAYSTYTVGSSDASFIVSANVLVTTATSHTFTTTVTYTDEGNTARTKTIAFSNITGASVTNIANTLGAVPYPGIVFQIRAKAGTTITIATTGTFTTVTYNIEASLQRVN